MNPLHGVPLRFVAALAVVLAVVCVANPATIAAEKIEISIAAGKYDRINAPVSVLVQLPKLFANTTSLELKSPDGKTVSAQLSAPSLLQGVTASSDMVDRTINFVVSGLKAGKTQSYTASLDNASTAKATTGNYAWHDTKNKHNELRFGDRPVLRYMYEPLDESSGKRRGETYKVYHHLFDPQGKRLLTKGAGGLFAHHRGLFYGFNHISYGDGKKADVWHCSHGEFQSHEKVVSTDLGSVLGRHLTNVDWHGQDGKVFAKELRELTAYRTAGGTLIEFASRLTSQVGTIKLDGDPQHAGFQFRATQHVPDKTKKLTYYLRPDGKGTPGKFRNWSPGSNEHINLPWNALSMVVDAQRYTVIYLDKPTNPKPARFSERDYGRFGSYFATQIETDKPLEVNYRIWVQEGQMSVDEAAAHSHNFVEPMTASAKVN